jgi:O-antigen/teichoic acid export membrane protein
VGSVFVARGISIAGSFAFAALVARQLGPHAAGTFFVLFAIFVGGATLGRFGTDNMAIKRMGTRSAENRRLGRRLLQMSAACSLFAAALVTAVSYVLLSSGLSGAERVAAAIIFGAAVIPAAVSVTASAILRAHGRVALGTLAELGSTPLIATVALLVWSATSGSGLFSTVVAFGLANVATSIWACWVTAADLRVVGTASEVAAPVHDEPLDVRGMASMMVTSLLFYLLTWAPVLALGLLGSRADAAYFNAAARLAAIVTLLPSIQVTYLAPRFAEHYRRGETGLLNALAQTTTRRATALGAVLGAVLVAFPAQALGIYGGEYAPATSSLVALTVAAVVVVALGPVNALMLIAGLEHWASVLNVATLAGAMLALVIVGPLAGAFGASLVMAVVTIAYSVTACVLLRVRVNITSHAFPSRRTSLLGAGA